MKRKLLAMLLCTVILFNNALPVLAEMDPAEGNTTETTTTAPEVTEPITPVVCNDCGNDPCTCDDEIISSENTSESTATSEDVTTSESTSEEPSSSAAEETDEPCADCTDEAKCEKHADVITHCETCNTIPCVCPVTATCPKCGVEYTAVEDEDHVCETTTCADCNETYITANGHECPVVKCPTCNAVIEGEDHVCEEHICEVCQATYYGETHTCPKCDICEGAHETEKCEVVCEVCGEKHLTENCEECKVCFEVEGETEHTCGLYCLECGEMLNEGVCELCTAPDMVGYKGVLKAGTVVYNKMNADTFFKWTLDNDHNITITEQNVVDGQIWYKYEVEITNIFDNVLYILPYVKAEDVVFGLGQDVDGVQINIYGTIPAGVELNAESVEIDIEEYSIEDESSILGAFDITLTDENGETWQPVDYDTVIAVELDAEAMGLEDGDIVSIHHNHEGEIETFDTFVVIDGKLTFWTDKFSIFVVQSTTDTSGNGANQIANNSTVTLTIDESKIYYSDADGRGEWQVSDPEGSISYTIHDDGTYVNYQKRAPWISVVALKPTVNTEVTLTYKTSNDLNGSSNTFKIRVVAPTSDLYIQDDVANTGCLVPVGLTGDDITYTWSRNDGQTIRAEALNTNGSVNISLDRGGVTNNREPITYTVVAKNADGTTVGTDSYRVLYGNEILNPSFEEPEITLGYGRNEYFYNGHEGLYWKTTAPGSSSSQVTQDIELAHENSNANDTGGTKSAYGISFAADGDQFAEVNAENFGALYQDILTTSGATLTWAFSHAGRHNTSSYTSENTLFVVVAATADAQGIITEAHIDDFLDSFSEINNSLGYTGNGTKIIYNGAEYYVWRHEGTVGKWESISGTYTVPEGQYLTRLFFVSDTNGTGSRLNKTCGNLIDAVSAGETMSYKIEYYLNGTLVNSDTQTGNATVYTTVDLEHLDEYEQYALTSAKLELEDGDVDYPGNVANGLYITNYGESKRSEAIVLKVYFAERAVSITKKIVVEGWAELTQEEQRAIIGNGLTAQFALTNGAKTYNAKLTIIAVSSTGELIAMGEFVDESGNAPVNGTYTVSEISAPVIIGYGLKNTVFDKQEVTISNANPTAAIVCTNTYDQQKVTIYYAVVNNFGGTVSPESESVAVMGNAIGSVATPSGSEYKFVGWFDNESGSGTALSTNASFVPTTPADGWIDGTTFYALFEYNLRDLKIVKNWGNVSDLYKQDLIFTISGGNLASPIKVVIPAGQTEITIADLTVGQNYTVTEDTDWAWRFNSSCDRAENQIQLSPAEEENVITFRNTIDSDNWLDANAHVKNTFENATTVEAAGGFNVTVNGKKED